MNKRLTINVNSEIGKLRGVILHKPGHEVENMTPENAQRALYSDILNLSVVNEEYKQFEDVLNHVTDVYYVKDLLCDLLQEDAIRKDLVNDILTAERAPQYRDELLDMTPENLCNTLIEGLPLKDNSLTNYLSKEKFALQPLHNFFFTRDASVSIWNNVLISKMANKVRERETHIMNSIFNHSFSARVVNSAKGITPNYCMNIEGGDVLIASDNVLVIGIGKRTSTTGVDNLISQLTASKDRTWHVIVQELPDSPESFIHLDMAFTFLDEDRCMVYEPLILKRNKYQTIHIKIDPDGSKKIETVENLVSALNSIDFDLKPLYCGGRKNSWIMEREQWHSGANFFALAPGKVIGYARNSYTMEELSNDGFEILSADKVISSSQYPTDYKKCMVALEGSELARGGGGARCMSMPVLRDPL
ncbi:arginine deiminase family protein [Saccharicrinis sp. FJH62]|uniref:arginine deiminase n=1 Tax=Saccharicrinis sp. FJH62 TaxID=3344657 RepID=UPI0035D4FDD0